MIELFFKLSGEEQLELVDIVWGEEGQVSLGGVKGFANVDEDEGIPNQAAHKEEDEWFSVSSLSSSLTGIEKEDPSSSERIFNIIYASF